MKTSTDNIPSTTDTPATPASGYAPTPAADPAPTPAPAEPKTDENGYTIVEPIPDPAATPDPAPAPDPTPDPKVEKPATGYGEKPAPIPEPKKDPTEDPKPGDAPKGLVQEDADAILVDSPNKEVISKFAMENNLSKEQLQNYVNLQKGEDVKFAEDHKNNIMTTRNKWHNELKEDPEFGGENFDKNVDSVEKVLEKNLPNWKKTLTDRGTMLPPYIMRDLLALSKVLNPTTKLVNGGPSEPVVKEEGNFLDDMYV